MSQGAISRIAGGDFRSGFYGGVISAYSSEFGFMKKSGDGNLMNIAKRTATAATLAGAVAHLGGGKFANGAVSGAFVHLFNNESNRGCSGRSCRQQVAEREPLTTDSSADYGLFRPNDHIYTVGRKGHDYVFPGPKPGVGKFFDDYILAGHTFGTDHDALVGYLVDDLGFPDLMVNIPSMPVVYMYSLGKEVINLAPSAINEKYVPFKHGHP